MIPGSANPLLLASAASAPAGYAISRSIRFNSSDSAYLSRTPSTAGNRKTWTWAGWVKRSALSGSDQFLFLCSTANTSPTTSWLSFNASEKLTFGISGSSRLVTTQVLRDASAWYHVTLAVDTTQATASDRYKLYLNGTQITAFDTADYVAQNTDTQINAASEHRVGRDFGSFTSYLNGYLADIHFIDGQALDPTSFGEFDTNGIWQPKAYTGSYGINGFHLAFSDNSTAGSLGDDTSGNNNDWTVNNISVAAGAGNDSLVDVPTTSGTDTGVGGEVRGNYCTWNPLDNGIAATLSNGNLTSSVPNTAGTVRSTIGVSSGKWYWEWTGTSGSSTGRSGIQLTSTANTVSVQTTGICLDHYDGSKVINGSSSSYGSAIANGDVVMYALDLDNGKFWVGKNGTWYNSGSPVSGTNALTTGLSGTYVYVQSGGGGGPQVGDVNMGARSFAYTAPSGFKALCTANLPAPVVTKPSEYMDVKLYTGNGSTQTISGLGFSPDLVWTKSRSSGLLGHRLQDAVRGATKELFSNSTAAENTNAQSLTSFNSDGFSIGSENGINQSGETFAAWTWDAGSSTVTNTQGSISSQVRANPSAGFSIVTWTGTGSGGATVGHGGLVELSSGMIIVKDRTTSGGRQWNVYHTSIGATKSLSLNTTGAASPADAGFWNNTSPTSAVFSLGTYNNEAQNYVAYCFAPVAGYSSMGSYVGNGSSDGPFVFCNFRPRWVMIKCSSIGSTNWLVLDTARDSKNIVKNTLFPNLSNSEDTASDFLDILSNGFKLRYGGVNAYNASSATYIYAAFAESPFQYARAR